MTARDRIALFVVLAAGALAAFWFLALAPKREQASALGAQIAAADARVAQAERDLVAYKAERTRYRINYATVARLGKAVPVDDDVPSLVFQIETAARSSNVDFRSLALGGRGGAAPAPPGSAPATQTAAASLPPGAAVGPAGFPTMPFSFKFRGDFFRLASFFHRLETFVRATRERLQLSGRLLTVDGIALSASAEGFPRMDATVAATAYLVPADEGLLDGAKPSGPAGATQGASGEAVGTQPAPASVTAATAVGVAR